MEKEIPAAYQRHLETRQRSILDEAGRSRALTFRGFWVGSFLSFFLAIGAPYGNMIIRGSYMALDFSTPGAIFLFLILIGVLNLLFKLAGQGKIPALLFALAAAAGWILTYWPFDKLDPYSPGLIFSTFLVVSSFINLPVALRGGSLALNRSELVLVYAMLLIVSALCSMGMGEQILPILTAVFYLASPENKWAEKLFPHLPERIVVDDGTGSQLFYEGTGAAGGEIPYGSWVEPLIWWGVFLLALYVTMICIAVIVRRQWIERERLAYPIAQVGLAMIRAEEGDHLINGFFKRPAMWLGCAIPLVIGSMKALQRYEPGVPVTTLEWILPFVGFQSIQFTISFALIGFSYFINANIAAGIWFFHLFAKMEKELFLLSGLTSDQTIVFGVSEFPLMAYQGVGALLAMVLIGFWIGRGHYGEVLRKAIGRAPEVDDSDEILSYRGAVFGAVGGMATMAWWLWFMGTPAWISAFFVVTAMLIFLGLTRIVAEAGLAVVRAPMIAPDLMVQGLGSALVGPTGVVNMSLAWIWAADVRVFVMATCANALRLIQEMDRPSRRAVFWALILAMFIGAIGSFWMIFHMAYRHGGINLNAWFFNGLPTGAYNAALRSMEPAGTYWPGWAFLGGGGVAMAAMMWARQRLPWWPLHPIGFPIGANRLMNDVWFSVFLAWFFKKLILRYGGAGLYQRSQPFFLGLISGQVFCNGVWLVIDYFTGKIGNSIFWL